MKNYDNSRLNTHQTCPRLYYYLYELGLREPKGTSARFSEWLVHLPLTEWYAHMGSHEPPWEALRAFFAMTPEEQAIKANAKYSIETAKLAFEFYTARFRSDFERFDVLSTEQYIVDHALAFGSKPDVQLREKTSGLVWTLEIKFSAWDFVTTGACMNPQFLGQVNNTRGHGVIVAQIMPQDAKWKTFQVYRHEIVPRPADMVEWESDTRARIAQVQASELSNVWPKHVPEACTRFNRECFFLGLCEAGAPQGMIDRMEHHDPLAYLAKKELPGGA